MTLSRRARLIALAATMGLALPALSHAADEYGSAAPGIEFEIGAAANVAPRYEGASEMLVTPVPLIKIHRLTLPNGFQIGGRDRGGFSVSPSFNVRGARKATDTPALTGLADVDLAVEFGAEVSYEAEYFRLHANLRRGFGGHEGWAGEAGADLVARPMEGLRVSAGPRVSYADDRYMDTYFSVPAGTAGFAAFNADGGIKSYGAGVGVRKDFDNSWAIIGEAGYDRLTGDAGSSPVTAVGSRDQFSVRLGVVRKFRFDF
ncbi:MAG: MipA/OmpV family protein [Roseitalea sp.]|nr:MipA/OmpV family protein [Roseitalea sp.]MBO6721859.1 MipA/OmpV family protein [Roseitalea sp.]MBO6744826.1 MipA/OmpV family protein [Roseitalea sp.]